MKKRHLKAPSAVLKPKLNTECTNNDVKGESDFPVAKPVNIIIMFILLDSHFCSCAIGLLLARWKIGLP